MLKFSVTNNYRQSGTANKSVYERIIGDDFNV